MDRNDSEIVQSNGIGLFTKEIDGDSLEMREAPEDTIEDGINTNALKHNTRVTKALTKVVYGPAVCH